MRLTTYLFSALAALSLFGAAWAQNAPFLADRHAKMGLQCEACHTAQGSPDLKMDEKRRQACVACHGWYDAVAKRTPRQEPDINPHSQHDGNLPCTECHKGHKQGVNYCGECHLYNFTVP